MGPDGAASQKRRRARPQRKKRGQDPRAGAGGPRVVHRTYYGPGGITAVTSNKSWCFKQVRVRVHHVASANSGPMRPRSPRRSTDGGWRWRPCCSGTRNFRGAHQRRTLRMTTLASQTLGVAYALGPAPWTFGPVHRAPGAPARTGKAVFHQGTSGSQQHGTLAATIRRVRWKLGHVFRQSTRGCSRGDETAARGAPRSRRRQATRWGRHSSYVTVHRPGRSSRGFTDEPAAVGDTHRGGGALALLRATAVTNRPHLAPPASIARDSPARRWLLEHGVARRINS